MSTSIKSGFEQPLKNLQFVKKSGSWYADRQETVLVAELQRSDHGEKYYVNLAVWFKRFGDAKFPKEYQCHIRIRLTSLMDGRIQKALDLEDQAISDTERAAILQTAMQEQGIPFLERCSTLEGVKSLLSDGSLSKAFVHRSVKGLIAGKE